MQGHPSLECNPGCGAISLDAAGADPSATIGEQSPPESHLMPLARDAAPGKRDDII